MKISTCEKDITPLKPCWQGGYVQRETYYTKVHDPIYATIFVLSFDLSRLVLISMDVSGVPDSLCQRILARCSEKGISLTRNEVIFGATHTHSGPLVGDHFDRTADPEYLELVIERISDGIVEACNQTPEEAELRYCKAEIDGLYSNRNDRNKRADKSVHLFGFFKEEKPLALIYSMAHHCTVLGPNFMELSADLFGEIRRLIKEELDVPVLMVQGNAGDMGNKQYRQSNLFDEVQRQALNLVDQLKKKRSSWITLDCPEYHFYKGSYKAVYDVNAEEFARKKADFEKQLETETNFDTIKLLVTGIKSFERKIAQGSRHVEREMPYRIYSLGDLQIVAVPGELGSILGMRIKAASLAKVCLLYGYADPCHLGYMIEKEAYEGFSQESNVTDYPAGIPDAYTEAIIRSLNQR